MFEKLKQAMLYEIRERIVSIKREQEVLNAEILNLRKIAKEYRSKESPIYDERYKETVNGFSFWNKLFFGKKCKEEATRVYNEIKSDYHKKVEEAENKISLIQEQISDKEKDIELLTQRMELVDNAVSIQELQLSFDVAKELLNRNGINIFDYTHIELLQLGPSVETTRNVQFMQDAIKEYPYNIMYDQTNNFDMYYNFISNLTYSEGIKEVDDLFNKAKGSVLEYLEQSKDGKIRIIPRYILETIRFFVEEVINEHVSLSKIPDAIVSRVKVACEKADALSDIDYHMLESMFNPDENDYYCHKGSMTEDILNSVLMNGLRVSKEGVDYYSISTNARKIDYFLPLAGYENNYGGHTKTGDIYRMIISIPKGTERPIGSDRADGNESHILPQYTIAYFKDTYDTNGLSRADIHLNNFPRKEYQYLYRDGYNYASPDAIINEDFMVKESGNQYH